MEYPLENIVAIDVWKSLDIRTDLKNYVLRDKSETLGGRIENTGKLLKKVLARLDGLTLPEVLKDKIRIIVVPIGNDIVKNYLQLFDLLKPDFDVYIDRLRWTDDGSVNKQKTVQMFLNDGSFKMSDRYLTACGFCCDKFDVDSWKKFTTEINDFLKTKNVNFIFEGTCHSRLSDLIALRSVLGLGEGTASAEMLTPCLTHSVFIKNSGYTFQQYWSILNPNQRVNLLEMFARRFISKPVCDFEVVIFLFFLMDDRLQWIFYSLHADFILRTILDDWTRHKYFLTTFKLIGKHITLSYRKYLLHQIVRGMVKDLSYVAESRIWFRELWVNTPRELVHHLFEDFPALVEYLTAAFDAQSIKLMLQDASPRQKKDIGTWIEEKMLGFGSMKQWQSFKTLLVDQVEFDEN